MAERQTTAVFALTLNALVWGLSWWPFRALHEQGVHPLWATAVVCLTSFAVFLALKPAGLRAFARQPLLWLLALAAGLTNVGFNWAVTVGDVVRVVLLFYLMPAWSVLLAWLLLGDRPSGAALLRLLVALAGVATILDTGGSGVPWPRTLADGLALVGGFSFALTNVLLRKLNAEPAAARVLAMFGGGTVLAGGVAMAGLLQGSIPGLPAPSSDWLLLVAVLSAGFLAANLALQYGAARLAAHTTALVMLSEVVFASFSSIALGASELTTRTIVGGLLILAAAAWSAWPRRD
jgi:drug/metabolite transporter (DMT)-like permease